MNEPTPARVVEPSVPAVEAPEVPGPVQVSDVLQQRTFHDSREVEAAKAAGLPTVEGPPLTPEAKMALREANQAIKNGLAWFDHAVKTLGGITS